MLLTTAILASTLAAPLTGGGIEMVSSELKRAENLRTAGRLPEAAETYRRLIHDPDRSKRIYALNGLAATELALGELVSAEKSLKLALALLDSMPKTDPSNRGVILSNFGSMYIRRGQPGKAQKVLEEAYHLLDTTLGPNHMQTARTRDNLAVSLHLQNNLDGARVLLEQSLEATRRLGDNPELATTLVNLGTVLADSKRWGESESRFHEALDLLPETHPDYPRTLLALARLYRMEKRWTDAGDAFLKSAAAFERIVGTQHHLYALTAYEYLTLPRKAVDKHRIALSKEAAIHILRTHYRDNRLDSTVDSSELIRTFR